MDLQKLPKRNSVTTDSAAKNEFDVSMNLENFLLEEYKHTSAISIQRMQDFTASLNLYFVLGGIFISGLGLGYQFNLINKPFSEPILLLFLIFFGVAHFFFFVRFTSFDIGQNELTKRMNIIRDFYVQKFKPQIPTIGDVIYSYADNSFFYKSLIPILGLFALLLAFMASLSFGGVAFLASELGFHINNEILFPLPSDIRPYIIGSIVCIATFVIQFLYFRKLQAKLSERK